MNGEVVGLDLDGVVAAALRYGATDPAAVQELASMAEAGLMEGVRERAAK